MKSWLGYSGHFLAEMRKLRLSVIELALMTAFALMCVVSAVDAITGHDPGNSEQLKVAKMQAQQGLMAAFKSAEGQ